MPWIERIFERLSAYYGARFADMWRGCDLEGVKKIWSDELGEFTKNEIAQGVKSCRAREWPPTLPEFLKLCRPELDYERAYLHAVEQMRKRESGDDEWNNAAIFYAARKIGNDLRNNPYQSIKTRWHSALDEAVNDIRTGKLPDEIPPRAIAIPAPGGQSMTKESAEKMTTEIESMLYTEKQDYRAWARKIIANPENYPYISVKFAKEALAAESGEAFAG